jgi:hypothetical protein
LARVTLSVGSCGPTQRALQAYPEGTAPFFYMGVFFGTEGERLNTI